MTILKNHLKLALGLLLVSSIIPSVSIAHVVKHYFNGSYVSLDIGANQHIYKNYPNIVLNIPGATVLTLATDDKTVSYGVRGNFGMGYSHVVNQKIYLALEANIGLLQKLKGKTDDNLNSLNNGLPTIRLDQERKESNHNLKLAGLFKIGFLTSDRTVLYGMIGPELSQFKETIQSPISGNFGGGDFSGTIMVQKTATRVGLALGVGIESYMTDRVSYGIKMLRGIYNHVPSIDAIGAISGGNTGIATVSNVRHVQSNAIFLNLSYYWC